MGSRGGKILPEGDFYTYLEETRKRALQTPGGQCPKEPVHSGKALGHAGLVCPQKGGAPGR